MGEMHPAELAGPHGPYQSLLSSNGGEEGILLPDLALAMPTFPLLHGHADGHAGTCICIWAQLPSFNVCAGHEQAQMHIQHTAYASLVANQYNCQ